MNIMEPDKETKQLMEELEFLRDRASSARIHLHHAAILAEINLTEEDRATSLWHVRQALAALAGDAFTCATR